MGYLKNITLGTVFFLTLNNEMQAETCISCPTLSSLTVKNTERVRYQLMVDNLTWTYSLPQPITQTTTYNFSSMPPTMLTPNGVPNCTYTMSKAPREKITLFLPTKIGCRIDPRSSCGNTQFLCP